VKYAGKCEVLAVLRRRGRNIVVLRTLRLLLILWLVVGTFEGDERDRRREREGNQPTLNVSQHWDLDGGRRILDGLGMLDVDSS
jgi:hypothetical protein